MNENDAIYDDEKQYIKIIDRYVTYYVPKISSHQPLIHKKYLDKIKRIVYMADKDPDNSAAEKQRWVDKSDKGFSTRLTSICQRRKKQTRRVSNAKEKLNYKLKKEREVLKVKY